jgi:hypothetical protein
MDEMKDVGLNDLQRRWLNTYILFALFWDAYNYSVHLENSIEKCYGENAWVETISLQKFI